MRRLYVETLGSGPRLVLVHGSVAGGMATWSAQRGLADEYTLVVPTRPGFLPNPPVDYASFDLDGPLVAELLEPGDHLAGHSYGGIVCLYAAAMRPEVVRSLTVVEPPCLGVARGHPAVDAFVEESERLWTRGPREPRAFLAAFLSAVGSGTRQPPDPLTPELEAGARTLMVERYPWEAEIDFETLAAAPIPKLVVSGAHSAAFDAVCDVLEARLGAERAVLPGAGHAAQRAPGFNDVLRDFLRRAGAGAAGGERAPCRHRGRDRVSRAKE